ncbi:hypothetical protein UAY_00146 [Enterococcus moraviensis ATCC BAA-383]|uniref:DUF1433 domain-containing protein n=1 Tax=Enterococcus moraviensis ATCC BAA-383 TaxID=1158609 RepID=R2TNM3_9ENTE|nr:hypothetical protein [Enterococcus moraviensis]EOI06804.1 hypothetical protein UAY_00146 [Enterococcus moraviensis ATCC BAA-383]EOT65147.1 hypothetical protein I586_02881 [Enterococcus moraviensis ATCC BAA-383]
MNKRIIILIGIIAIVFMGFGGKLYMDKKAEEKAKEEQRNLLETERESAIVLKNKYQNLKKIVFIDSYGPDKITGSYDMSVTITSKNSQSVTVNFSYWKEANDIGSIDVIDEGIQKNGATTSKVDVVYTNGEKGGI